MTKNEAALYPGEYFIELQERPDSKWEVLYRDNDPDVMLTRYQWRVTHLKPGQSVKFFDPTCKVLLEHSRDPLPAPPA